MPHWANAYQGARFKDVGRGPDFDCYGLARDVWNKLCGLDLPEYGDLSAYDVARIAALMGGDAQADMPWIEVPLPKAREFDALIMRRHGSRVTGHMGVMTGPKHVLHIEKGIDAVVVPVSHFTIQPRIVAVRRHRSLA